jgi:predicted dehydrogenase
MIKVALIGLGKMGLSHCAILSAHQEVEVVAICDSASYLTSAMSKQMNAKTFKNYAKMIKEEELDAVIVSTPNSTHFEIAKMALANGLHVFLEKPLCLDPNQSVRLSELANEYHVVNQVGYHNRFLGTFQEMRKLIKNNAIGDLYHIEGTAYGQVVIRQKAGRTWRSKKSEGGGCLHDYACHVVDLMNFIYQPPIKVISSQLQSIFSIEIEDAVYAAFDYKSGATGILEANWSDQSYRKMSTTITAFGTAGKIVTDRQEIRVYLTPGNKYETYSEGWTSKYITDLQKPVNFYLRGEEYSAQLDQFVESIKGVSPGIESTFGSAAETDYIIDQIAVLGRH